MSVVPVDAIIKAVEGLYWVYENCFVNSNAADVLYWDFGRKVKNFLESGGRLHGALARASRSSTGKGVSVGRQAQRLVEDFEKLAAECKNVLRDKSAFGQKRNNALVNFSWHAGGSARRVEALKERMQDHEREVHFFIQSYQPDAHETKLNEILALAKKLNQVAPKPKLEDFEVPPGLEKRFMIAKTRHPPPPDSQAREALVAASGHLAQSTKIIQPGEEQTVYEYINLRKVQWLLLRLRRAQALAEHDFGELVEGSAIELEEQCAQQLAREDLVHFTEHDFQSLPDSAFFIWVFQEFNALPRQIFENFEENLLYEADLPAPRGAQSCRVQVYRQLSSFSRRASRNSSQNWTGTNLRIVRTWHINGERESPRVSVQHLNTFQDGMYLVYLFTRSLNDQFRIDLRCDRSSMRTRYDFDSYSDLYRFQWALSAFTVASDTSQVKFTLVQPLTHQKNMPSGNARVQMWLWDPEERLARPDAQYPPSSGASSAGMSSLSTVTSPVYLPFDPDINAPNLTNGESRQRNYSKQTIHQALLPYPPLLVLFCRDERGASYICLELKDGVEIDASKCDCKQKANICKRAVLKKAGGGNLKVTRIISDTDSPEGLPNSALLAKPDYRGENPHPEFYRGPESETIDMVQMVLSFVDVPTRTTFVRKFNLTREMRRQTERAGSLAEDVVRQQASVSIPRGVDSLRLENRNSLP